MILIIGATGFIGSYLIRELKNRKKEIIGTVYKNNAMADVYKKDGIEIYELNITNKEDFTKLPHKNIDAVILLSALLPANVSGEEDKYEYIKVNVEGTLNVLEFCRKHNIKKMISTTTYADVQNIWNGTYKITEEENRNYKYEGDHAVYVFSKNMATDLILHYAKEYNMENAIFRLPPVYGVGPHGTIYVDGKLKSSGIETFIEKAKKSESIEIWGDKNLKRDIVYIKDVASCIANAIDVEKLNGLYNLTSGTYVTLEEQVKKVIDIFSPQNNKSKIFYKSDLNLAAQSFLFSIDKAKKDLNYKPNFINFEDMMLDYKEEMEKKENVVLKRSREK